MPVLSLPMRNWNNCLYLTLFLANHVLSLPMRNWNWLSEQISHTAFFVLSLPMRNWNDFSPRKPFRYTSSQPTYEELKHEKDAAIFHSNQSSQPTYEELKRRMSRGSLIRRPCSQPTYEELKRISSFSLISSNTWFSAYLWGIETYIHFEFHQYKIRSQPTYEELKQLPREDKGYPICPVLSLPMRNWNN